MTSPALALRRCQGLTKSGQPCEATPLTDRDWCFFHSPEHRELAREARLQGSELHRKNCLEEAKPLDLSTTKGVLKTLSLVATATLKGDLDHRRANALAVICSTATRALQNRLEDRVAEIEAAVAMMPTERKQ